MWPAFSDWNASSALFGSAPITRICGRIPFEAIEVPESNPPPETGAMTKSRSGTSSSNSSAAVPWPAMI